MGNEARESQLLPRAFHWLWRLVACVSDRLIMCCSDIPSKPSLQRAAWVGGPLARTVGGASFSCLSVAHSISILVCFLCLLLDTGIGLSTLNHLGVILSVFKDKNSQSFGVLIALSHTLCKKVE